MEILMNIYKAISTVIVISTLFCNQTYGKNNQEAEHIFEKKVASTANSKLDKIVEQMHKQKDLKFANESSDGVFIRRLYINLTGELPTAKQAENFIKNKDKKKRSKLIDNLLDSEKFANYLTLKWCDLLRVKAEFPINLWPNAVQAYNRWIYDAVKNNLPYDKFAYKLLTSSGSNFKTPETNFYRAVQIKTPKGIASAVALTFMGMRFDKLSKEKQNELIKFFSKVRYKKTAEWKEEIVYSDLACDKIIKAQLPDGTEVQISQTEDPREFFAHWLINSNNSKFNRNIVNRIWSWLFGYGIIEPADDIRKATPPLSEELLTYLESELKKSNYNLKDIYKLILNSKTYQQSPIPKNNNTNSEQFFACYPIKQLNAEVIIDALNRILGKLETYSSKIPEPFTFVPEEHRTISLADGSISSQLLEMFGRPARDSGLESERINKSSPAQRLHMINSSQINDKIMKYNKIMRGLSKIRNKKAKLDHIYLTLLSRYPTKEEINIVNELGNTDSQKKISKQVRWRNYMKNINTITWALINSKEFLFNH